MSRRHVNRLATRKASRCRADMVHAAGCTHQECVVRVVLRNPESDMFPEFRGLPARTVRVPRSLRHIYGATIEPLKWGEP